MSHCDRYWYLIFFLAEFAHVASTERRAHILGEAALNLPDDCLCDLKAELIELRADELPAQRLAA